MHAEPFRDVARFQLDSLERRLLLAAVPAGFTDSTVVTGLSSPTSMVVAADGRIFVTEQNGDIQVIKNGQLLSDAFFTLPLVNAEGERGLLGIELDPDFESNGFIYVYYTTTDGGLHNRLARLTANGDQADPNSLTDLLDLPPIDPSAIYHFGGALHFGPDRKLYVSVGDHLYFDGNKLQTLEIPFGKILRVNPDGSIPADNPWYDQASGINRAAWAMGLRNPFTFNFQPGTVNMLINDVGQETWEEIDVGQAGGNYGWPSSEGPENTNGFIAPIYTYKHGPECAITGSVFYNPATSQFPAAYTGKYFFADLCGGWIRSLDRANGNAVADFASGLSSPVDLDLGNDGSLLYLERGADNGQGSIGQISFTASTTGAPTILSQPRSQTAGIGQTITLDVSATGSNLNYQWQRNGRDIAGATDSTYTITNARPANGGVYRVLVSNTEGSVLSDPATITITQAASGAPSARIVFPAPRTRFTAGQTYYFSGRGTDPEEGSLGASHFSWQVDYITGKVVRPFLTGINNARTGTFTIPTETPYKEANVVYRIRLTITDSEGHSSTAIRDLRPRTGTITLTSTIPGAKVFLDEQPKGSTTTFTGVAGMKRVLGADATVTYKNRQYVFDGWSDGGEIEHHISTPVGKATYTARYRRATGVSASDQTAAPTADAFVYAATPEANFGGLGRLDTRVHSRRAHYERDTFLKFDIRSLPDTFAAAKLRLYGQLSSAAENNVVTAIYAAPAAKWGESSIKWSNRPATQGRALATATVADSDLQWYEFDITRFLQQQKQLGHTIVTFVLRNVSSSTVVAAFNSRESPNDGPELRVSA